MDLHFIFLVAFKYTYIAELLLSYHLEPIKKKFWCFPQWSKDNPNCVHAELRKEAAPILTGMGFKRGILSQNGQMFRRWSFQFW